ncbi:7TM GPCR, olfactory receptor/chemoreceptor Srsx family-containing protein [Strongyloides ratti]|uniref:7TM GPCR, olfactory receptor/chemoreceptor Srsx family-containing protein n=1 Tax=Strongyloides ratti TaxID=34506 RepID=A0A090L4X0_STRRB|nr:7TM GPCR, olfactory receptor/chemoreceptor Srsx family-containing protein [Strongyloides ratti]CEF64747.1 7TM GPCR, olfactory receptor/chemoreceptor Srsx family-containing protein [Strongyloides ratti]
MSNIAMLCVFKASPKKNKSNAFHKLYYVDFFFKMYCALISSIAKLQLFYINGYFFWHIQRLSYFEFNITTQIIMSILVAYGNYIDITFLTGREILRHYILWYHIKLTNKSVCLFIFLIIFTALFGVLLNGVVFFDRVEMPMKKMDVSLEGTQTTLEDLFSKSIVIKVKTKIFMILIFACLLNYRKLILFLAIGDLCNCIYVFMQGYERKEIYLLASETGYIQNQTYWTCALKVFDWMGLLGSLIPHIVTFVMGIERLIAFRCPIFFKRYLNKSDIKACIFCFIYTFINIILAFTLAFLHRDTPSRYYCGRKVSYTHVYISFIYGMSVFGYVSCFLITLSVLIYLKFLLNLDKKVIIIYKKNTNESKDFKRRIKSYQRIKQVVVISFISSITISLPNFISLASVVVGPLDSYIADTADCISVGKSSINFFVYLIFDKEFRNSIIRLYENIRQLLI